MSTQNVTWSQPFGKSALQQGLNQLGNNIGDIGGAVPNPSRSNPNDPQSSSYTGNSPSTNSGSQGTAQAPATALSSLAGPQNTSMEDALRASYLSSLKPNYGYTFAGQNNPATTFNAVPGAKGK